MAPRGNGLRSQQQVAEEGYLVAHSYSGDLRPGPYRHLGSIRWSQMEFHIHAAHAKDQDPEMILSLYCQTPIAMY
jgi:hypothetical protein